SGCLDAVMIGTMKRVLLSWSSGKDSAWTLHVLRHDPSIEVCALLTMLNQEFDRVAMHGVRHAVLEAQAAAAGLPLWVVPLPWPCSNEIYEELMAEACQRAIAEGIEAVAFGDLFLVDVRAYRVRQLAGTGLEPIFPLWQIPTDQLAREMIAGGLRARLTCIDSEQLPAEFAGREFDEALLKDLPASADPCGEKGEYHSCVYAGPMFNAPLEIAGGEIVTRERFVFADLLLAPSAKGLYS
ncbi:MAG: ATP-binding protein, partial [Terracidiphilus sp.]